MPFDGLISNANYEVETVHLCIDAQEGFLKGLSPERAASFPAELRRFADQIEPAIPTIWVVSGSATFWPYPASTKGLSKSKQNIENIAPFVGAYATLAGLLTRKAESICAFAS